MTDKQVKALLELASEKVPCGIYAIRKGVDYYEMKNTIADTEMREAIAGANGESGRKDTKK